MNISATNQSGSCTCGYIQYTVSATPLIVHCCHCSWCQRETGTAFATNALVEKTHVEITSGECELIDTPSNSGKGQKIARCPKCRVAVWSHYSAAGPAVCFIRVGTLQQPLAFPPDVHIYIAAKQPWVVIPESVPAYEEFYDPKSVWPGESLERYYNAVAS